MRQKVRRKWQVTDDLGKQVSLADYKGKMMDGMMKKRDADYAQKADIKWNFTKFLVSRDGRVVKRYEPTDKMSDVEAGISQELNPTR